MLESDSGIRREGELKIEVQEHAETEFGKRWGFNQCRRLMSSIWASGQARGQGFEDWTRGLWIMCATRPQSQCNWFIHTCWITEVNPSWWWSWVEWKHILDETNTFIVKFYVNLRGPLLYTYLYFKNLIASTRYSQSTTSFFGYLESLCQYQ